jgi:hypothetical protein
MGYLAALHISGARCSHTARRLCGSMLQPPAASCKQSPRGDQLAVVAEPDLSSGEHMHACSTGGGGGGSVSRLGAPQRAAWLWGQLVQVVCAVRMIWLRHTRLLAHALLHASRVCTACSVGMRAACNGCVCSCHWCWHWWACVGTVLCQASMPGCTPGTGAAALLALQTCQL